ncbi:hypothetical protein Glove_501g12 [Diversispora epigaea]|uniref:Uncharacterized protein n=1 Tax=Diversispora epigaea TaxID=1348612 RepID=A0A397GIJ7_9GLOM|nr:hypothetical protein Glove_501g12 [Diversispora epigaea]
MWTSSNPYEDANSIGEPNLPDWYNKNDKSEEAKTSPEPTPQEIIIPDIITLKTLLRESTLYNLGVVKTNKEKPLSSDQTNSNIVGNSKEIRVPYINIYYPLSWKDLLASQVISDESEFVRLPGNLKKGFMKPVRKMTPTPMPMVQEMCREFVLDFKRHEIKTKPAKLIHGGTWKESKEDTRRVVKEILNKIRKLKIQIQSIC